MRSCLQGIDVYPLLRELSFFYREGGRLFVIAGCQFFLVPPPICECKKFWSPPWHALKNSGPPFAHAKNILVPSHERGRSFCLGKGGTKIFLHMPRGRPDFFCACKGGGDQKTLATGAGCSFMLAGKLEC